MTITVLGAGYVGLTTATIFACAGHTVHLVEPNAERLASIKKGVSFFYEDGLNALLGAAIKSKQLLPTASYQQALTDSKVVFSAVGTPDNPDGSSNLSYVFAAATSAIELMQPGTIFVQKSTVPVGTGEKIEQLFAAAKKDFAYVSNPEFLREGTALADTLFFDRVVVGGTVASALDTVISLYQDTEAHRARLAALAGIESTPREGRYIRTSRNSAELIKVTSNAFLALKISFANSIAKLADKTNADINEVMEAVGADPRIGRAFLNAGRGYGGGCFPKDVSGLVASGLANGIDLEIMQAAQNVNLSMPGFITEKLQAALGGSLSGKKIAVLGLSFKAGTSDTRRSPGVALANLLDRATAEVRAYDPEANHEAAPDLRANIQLCDSLEAATKHADAVIVATDWPLFLSYDLAVLAQNLKGTHFVDAMNAFDRSSVEKVGLNYIGVGRNGAHNE